MTRIIIGIAVTDLTDEHLLAEHREIKRVCYRFKERLQKNAFADVPKTFRLGNGHELYFITRPQVTLLRYTALYNECKARNFMVDDYSSNWDIYQQHPFTPDSHKTTTHDAHIVARRIVEKITQSKKPYFHYRGTRISKGEACEKLRKYLLQQE